jgi:hypothetical protein
MEFHDGYVFRGDEDVVIFNHYSFSVLAKQIMVKCGWRALQEAEKLFDESGLAVRPIYFLRIRR